MLRPGLQGTIKKSLFAEGRDSFIVSWSDGAPDEEVNGLQLSDWLKRQPVKIRSLYSAIEYDVIREALDSYVVLNERGNELQVLKANFEIVPEVHTLASTMTEEMYRHLNDVPPAPLQDAGVNPKDTIGANKPDLSLVPPSAIIHMSTAMQNGADKYGAYNWRTKKVQVMTYLAAADRHLKQFLDGEDYAADSGVHHLAHAAACYAIVLDAMETGNLVDNRPPAGAASRLIADLTKGGTT